jgi:hypothetical protein
MPEALLPGADELTLMLLNKGINFLDPVTAVAKFLPIQFPALARISIRHLRT